MPQVTVRPWLEVESLDARGSLGLGVKFCPQSKTGVLKASIFGRGDTCAECLVLGVRRVPQLETPQKFRPF